MSSGEARRRAEIEAKRAKLAELRKAREERSSRLLAGKAGSSESKSASEAATPSSRRDIDELVANLVGSSASRRGGSGTPSSPQPNRSQGGGETSIGASGRTDGFGTAAGSTDYEVSEQSVALHATNTGTTLVTRADGEVQSVSRPSLVDSEAQTEQLDVPPKAEKVYYTKETQTAFTDESAEQTDGQREEQSRVSAAEEEAIRQKILREQEVERIKQEELALKRQEEQLEQEIERDLRELTSEELGAIFGQSEFVDFVEQSSRIVERALTDSYDFLKDYRQATERADDAEEGRQVKLFRAFRDEKLCKGRSITDLDWSTKHPELVVASYSRSENVSNDDPDGLVLVWNLHLSDRPEFVFHAQTDVLSVAFSPFHSNLVIGGTYSGQILIWDTRARQLPVLKTPLSAAGHTHPIYNIRIVGTQNAHNLISASTDGTVCSWMLDMLARPQETVELLNTSHTKTDEVSVTAMAFPDQETTSFWVGTEEGNVYTATRYDRAGWKAGIDMSEVYRGHAAPVTGLHFHPLRGPVDFSDLFLTSSMDWTSRLWRLRNTSTSSAATMAAASGPARGATTAAAVVHPLCTIEEASDYVYDVAWHTLHPALFGQVDGSGKLDIFNLNVDTERPVASVSDGSGRALNKVRWDRRDGKRVATGGADGRISVYDVGSLAVPRDEEWLDMQKTLGRLRNAAGGPGAQIGNGSGAAANAASNRFPAANASRTVNTSVHAGESGQRIAAR